jgi:hypothetical protein
MRWFSLCDQLDMTGHSTHQILRPPFMVFVENRGKMRRCFEFARKVKLPAENAPDVNRLSKSAHEKGQVSGTSLGKCLRLNAPLTVLMVLSSNHDQVRIAIMITFIASCVASLGVILRATPSILYI